MQESQLEDQAMARNTTEDEFKEAMKRLRKDLVDAGMDDAEAALDIGVSRPTFKRWADGQHIPRQQVRDAYMDELDRFRREKLRKKVPGLHD